MNAADVMVSNVITVGPDATVQEVAGILLKNKGHLEQCRFDA